jgi:transcription elongation GreA/GreB family factor
MSRLKEELRRRLSDVMRAQQEELERSARQIHAEATHEQSKAENKYDTRALEASYLAEGQTRLALEIARSLELLQEFEPRDFSPGESVDLGALVEISGAEAEGVYFLAPCAGGTALELGGRTVQVITPLSPMGKLLIGRKTGDALVFVLGKLRQSYRVVAVQ